MILAIGFEATYSLGMACNCPKGTEGQCGINYRVG